MLNKKKYDLLNRLKQIRNTLNNAINDYEEEDKVNSEAIDEVAIKSIRKQLSYLRQFYTDEEIASKIGVKPRQLKRWENGACKPLPRNGWALKALYDEERKKRGNGR